MGRHLRQHPFLFGSCLPDGAGGQHAFFIPQGNIRGRVMGFDPSVPTEEQLEEMKALVREAMEAGCIGFTTGLV